MNAWHPINPPPITPKTKVKPRKMSDTKEVKTREKSSEGGLSEADTTFLVTCLQHATGGSISIDTEAVAAILNYSNPRSVGNKIGTLKKRLNLPIGTSKASDGGSSPAVPKTPSSDRVSKPKSTPRKKATPKKKDSSEDGEGEAAEDGATTPTAAAKRGRPKKAKKEPVKEESADEAEVQEPNEEEFEGKVEEDEFEEVDEA